MDIMELLKNLVETDDKMARMTLVEENKNIIETSPSSGDETLQVELEQTKTELEALKQKYIDTFFGSKEPEEKEEDKDKSETITIDDLLGGV